MDSLVILNALGGTREKPAMTRTSLVRIAVNGLQKFGRSSHQSRPLKEAQPANLLIGREISSLLLFRMRAFSPMGTIHTSVIGPVLL
jgi:hypothetical protein